MGGRARGRLRVYLGAAPGVGKTFAMLSEARRARERDKDVVVGFVETHGRARTAKRRQDVDEILDAGIDVVSTVNIQHLESLNDVVEQITGVPQRETVPDEVVRRADMSPEALRRRLAHGNVDQPERVDAALTARTKGADLLAVLVPHAARVRPWRERHPARPRHVEEGTARAGPPRGVGVTALSGSTDVHMVTHDATRKGRDGARSRAALTRTRRACGWGLVLLGTPLPGGCARRGGRRLRDEALISQRRLLTEVRGASRDPHALPVIITTALRTAQPSSRSPKTTCAIRIQGAESSA